MFFFCLREEEKIPPETLYSHNFYARCLERNVFSIYCMMFIINLWDNSSTPAQLHLKMTTVFEECTPEIQWSVVCFMWENGLLAKDIHKEKFTVYSDNCFVLSSSLQLDLETWQCYASYNLINTKEVSVAPFSTSTLQPRLSSNQLSPVWLT